MHTPHLPRLKATSVKDDSDDNTQHDIVLSDADDETQHDLPSEFASSSTTLTSVQKILNTVSIVRIQDAKTYFVTDTDSISSPNMSEGSQRVFIFARPSRTPLEATGLGGRFPQFPCDALTLGDATPLSILTLASSLTQPVPTTPLPTLNTAELSRFHCTLVVTL
jgi:hypothetical protein